MKLLRSIGEEEKRMIKLFLVTFAITTIILLWCYVSFLFILNAFDFNLTFDSGFLLGLSMIFSALMFACAIED